MRRLLLLSALFLIPELAALAQTPATPTFSPVAGSYMSAQLVSIICSLPAMAYYTTNGSTPTTASTLYSSPVVVSATATLKAICSLSMVTVTPAGRAINVGDQLQFTAKDESGNDITALGSTTWTTSNAGIASLQGAGLATGVSAGTATITASSSAIAPANSMVGSATYTITITGTVQPPTITPATGKFYSSPTVTLADTTAGSTIYFTTDGSTPTTGSTVYTVPFMVSTSSTVKAIAAKAGMVTSGVAANVLTIFPPGTVAPAASGFGVGLIF